MIPDLTGLWVPVVTPLDADDQVDAEALGRLARRLLDQGCSGLVALGTTGEPATLRLDERRDVVDVCAEACAAAGKPLMVGVGSNCTQSTMEEVAAFEGTPALTAFLVVVPYYTRPAVAGTVDHFRAVAAASETPIVVYNVPYRTGRGLDADALVELAGTPRIVGVKQAVGALDHDTLELMRQKPPEFQVLAGDDAFIAPTILMGGSGAIAASAHVCTDLFARMIHASLAGASDTEESSRVVDRPDPLITRRPPDSPRSTRPAPPFGRPLRLARGPRDGVRSRSASGPVRPRAA